MLNETTPGILPEEENLENIVDEIVEFTEEVEDFILDLDKLYSHLY